MPNTQSYLEMCNCKKFLLLVLDQKKICYVYSIVDFTEMLKF
jgi:hypothetical protein